MNLPIEQLPERCDVLVVGAGPAGAAAAIALGRAGVDVVLIDQHAFPRDKVCGDGLIPDAHHALRRLGVLDEVMARAQPVTHAGLISPRGIRVDVPGSLAVLPRLQLDQIVCNAAVRAGARMFAPLRFVAPVEEQGVVVGARVVDAGVEREIRCQWLVLASGAVPQALIAAGMALRQRPSGVALRGYLKNEAMQGRIDKLEVVWHRAVAPGYGWIFPCRDGVFNVGVGAFTGQDLNLRALFEAFTHIYPAARDLVAGGHWLAPLKGAPLRTSLTGARFSRPGLLVSGEAAGSTYAFTGEGIGKALETGLLAAEAVLAGRRAGHGEALVRADYEAKLAALKPRFTLYERANWVNHHPWLADLVLWRGQRSPRVLRRMSGVLDESSNPGHLLTFKGVVRLMTE
ncbi:MAG: geranylgeranyl reductase family protein [Piscinibacter sp.]